MAKSVCKKKLILFLFLYKYHTTTTTMAYFDTIKEFPHSGNLKFIRTADKIDNMEFNRDTPVVKGEQFLPSIYMFSLGKVKELRESLSIRDEYDDDFVVAKCGFTKDFTNTTETLKEKYDYIDNVDLQLLQHCFIDQTQIFKAEKEIRVRIGGFSYLAYNNGEFLIIPPYMMNEIPHIYRVVGQTFTGKNALILNLLNDTLRVQGQVMHLQTAAFESKLLLINAELEQKDSEIDIIKRDSTIEQKRLKAEMEENRLKAENKELKMMALEQQILDQKIIIENMTNTQKN